jgi:hypothetical protein
MPSRASYSRVPIYKTGSNTSTADQPLDPESPSDKDEILLAAQLSRIVCRKLEIDGYRALQTRINVILSSKVGSSPSYNNDGSDSHGGPAGSDITDATSFVTELGKILLSLRWRMSWWEFLGSGSPEPDPFRDKFVERVRGLIKILYFYYFSAKRSISSWTYYTERDLQELGGVWSSYPDSVSVWDDFPVDESVSGFEEWVERGKGVIKRARAKEVVKK